MILKTNQFFLFFFLERQRFLESAMQMCIQFIRWLSIYIFSNIYYCIFFFIYMIFLLCFVACFLALFITLSFLHHSVWKALHASSPLPENHCHASVVSNFLSIHSYLKNCIWQWFQNRPVSIVECSGICGCLLFLLASVSNSTTFILGRESSRKWVHWNLTPSLEWGTLYHHMQTSRCAKTVEVTIVGVKSKL